MSTTSEIQTKYLEALKEFGCIEATNYSAGHKRSLTSLVKRGLAMKITTKKKLYFSIVRHG